VQDADPLGPASRMSENYSVACDTRVRNAGMPST